MKLTRNREFFIELIGCVLLTIAFSIGGAFLSLRTALLLFLLGLCLTALVVTVNLLRYRRIASLTASIERILHGTDRRLIKNEKEGELSILEDEIAKRTVRLKEQSDRLLREKGRLTDAIADIFHQMRTPLTSMTLTVSLLENADLPYERRLHLTRELKKQLSRVTWMVETLLKMSKIDAGTALFRREDVLAKDLIDRACAPFLIPMELRGQTLVTDAGEARLNVDPSFTAEALSNVVKNCTEHTPDGGTIAVRALETALYTEIVVEDTGEGFCKDDLPHLFERFYKGKNATEGSIGIGMAYARSIVTAEDGTLTAENRREGGARFIFKFYKSVV